jgi:hypothetical protein
MGTFQGKICRICWNTDHWRRPSGKAASLETGSYVSEHGFGHEEWLFNYEWMIDGYRYAFVQPIHKYLRAYEGRRLPLLLHTIDPDRNYLAVARIANVYVPLKEELTHVKNLFIQRGWLDQMRDDLRRIVVETTPLDDPSPWEIANIRFMPTDVQMFEPRPVFVPGKSGAPDNIIARYMPFNWNGKLDFLMNPTVGDLGEFAEKDRRRSEATRQRAAQQGTEVDPRQVRMQNRLFLSLKKRHASVSYEENFVDLIGRDPGCVTYYELKTESTARLCIRQAIGQLLDYSHYPNSHAADRLVVVGDAPVTAECRAYLKLLQEKFNLPLHYGWFCWDTGDLVELV